MGTGESSSRARGDKEGPNGAASSARLIHGLQRTKEERRRRATGPPFSARNGPPTRARRTNPMVAGSIPAGALPGTHVMSQDIGDSRTYGLGLLRFLGRSWGW